jgi:mannose-1-phosphate guanylyltransferase
MYQRHTHLVVMAGGIGQRLWPWSTKSAPKQFQDFLLNGRSLLQITLRRFQSLIEPHHIWVVTQSKYKSLVQKQLPWLHEQQILCEPVAKNTAICIAYACQVIAHRDPLANLIVTPADHYIVNEERFQHSLQQALKNLYQRQGLTLLGVPCIKPETGYGYIAFLDHPGSIKPVTGFKEKPLMQQALVYMQQGNYAWNTGIFIGKIETFIEKYKAYLPQIWDIFEANRLNLVAQKNLSELYEKLPEVSFDKAILEKSSKLSVVYQEFGWSDLGSWEALYEHLPKDQEENLIQGKVFAWNTQACLIKNDDSSLVATCGIKDLVIVKRKDMLLVCSRHALKDLKNLTKKIAQELGHKDF